MGAGLYSLATWVEPFGLLKHELRKESALFEGGELAFDIAVYALALAFDLVTLPLALLQVVGIGTTSEP